MSRHHPPQRILLGPGPSQVPPRVLAALAAPTVGYLDPTYVEVMRETRRLMQRAFATENAATFAVTGPGTAAMECAVVNLVEPGDRAIACVHGYFGDRLRQMLERNGAHTAVVAASWGEPTDPGALAATLEANPGTKVVTVVHGETSTGVRQAIEPLARVVHQHDALLVVDAVASLGGVPFEADAWGADVVYTGSQKCLSVPPGISPITFSPAAMAAIEGRRTPCRSWFLDAPLNLTYWADSPVYHHTGPINLTYALLEGLRMLEEEGREARFARTEEVAASLWAGLEAMGLELVVAPEHRLPTLTTVAAPPGVDEARVRARLLDEFSIEIAGGLGDLKGKAWRVGLMGASCTRANVIALLGALEVILAHEGHEFPAGAGIRAAAEGTLGNFSVDRGTAMVRR